MGTPYAHTPNSSAVQEQEGLFPGLQNSSKHNSHLVSMECTLQISLESTSPEPDPVKYRKALNNWELLLLRKDPLGGLALLRDNTL